MFLCNLYKVFTIWLCPGEINTAAKRHKTLLQSKICLCPVLISPWKNPHVHMSWEKWASSWRHFPDWVPPLPPWLPVGALPGHPARVAGDQWPVQPLSSVTEVPGAALGHLAGLCCPFPPEPAAKPPQPLVVWQPGTKGVEITVTPTSGNCLQV